MPTCSADDGTRLAYRIEGHGPTVLCLPGGPMLPTAYLGDLGGLPTRARLVLLDPRGTGASGVPDDPATYRCDRQVVDVEAVRRDVGLDRVVVLGHSAGANLALRFAERHPERVAALVLVTPSPFGVGLPVTPADRQTVLDARGGEPWHAAAVAAFARVATGDAGAADWAALAPLRHGRWDDETRAFDDAMQAQGDDVVAEAFSADGAFDPDATTAALHSLDAPVLVVAGELDANSPPRVMAELAAIFPHGTLRTLRGAGHFPWRDDAAWFVDTVADALPRIT